MSATMSNGAAGHDHDEDQTSMKALPTKPTRAKLARMAAQLTVAAGIASAWMSPAAADAVADFYRGKTVIYNLAVPDGASWGLYARTFIEHLRKHIPGNPTVILQVMPGGGGVAASNYIYNVAARDGTVIGTPLSTAIVFAATDPKEVMFDPRKFSWLGSLAVVQDVISVWHTAPAQTIDAAKKTELIMGATGKGSNSFQDIALANNLLGTKFKAVRGYKGGAEINIAIERGEVNGRSTTWETWPGSHPQWLKEKKIVHLVQLGPRKLAEIGDDVPLFRDLVSSAEDKAIVDFVGLSLTMGRSVYAPPGVPAERVAALRKALVDTVKDPDYIAQAQRLALDAATWQPGEAIEKVVNDAFSLPPAVVEKAKAAMDLP
jgi:tripartite-type tricarboxylate transporter receptor subunit TctC